MTLRLLRRTDYVVHLHHCQVKNFQERSYVEEECVKRTFAWFNHNYPNRVELTNSIIDFTSLGRAYDDAWPLAMMAATVVSSLQRFAQLPVEAAAIGLRGGDERFHSVKRTMPRWRSIRPSYLKNLYYGHFNDTFISSLRRPLLFPINRRSRRAIHRWMPQQLRDNTWSCREPIREGSTFYACNKCHTCLEYRYDGLKSDKIIKI